MAHWLCVTTAENWSRYLATKTWGVTDHYKGLIKRAVVSDDLLVHVVGMKCAGIYRIARPHFHSEEPIWPDDVYPHRVQFEPVLVPPEPVDIKQFYYSFFPTMSPQGYYRTAFRELPEDEFELFKDFLENGKVQTLEVGALLGPPESEFALSLERDLEDYLEANLQVIEPGLRLYREGDLSGRQFEFIQRTWVDNPNFPEFLLISGLNTGDDALIGQHPRGRQKWPKQWGRGGRFFGRRGFNFGGFVRLRGGEYFFAPSLSFLRDL